MGFILALRRNEKKFCVFSLSVAAASELVSEYRITIEKKAKHVCVNFTTNSIVMFECRD